MAALLNGHSWLQEHPGHKASLQAFLISAKLLKGLMSVARTTLGGDTTCEQMC